MSIEFYGAKNPFGEFSNFYASPMTIDGIEYKNVEQYFQCEKARLSNDNIMLQKIMNTSNPVLAKRYGKAIKNLPLDEWDRIRDSVMKRGVLEKFKQNNKIKLILESTKDVELIEASPRDCYWGCGSKKTGKNMLGKILMDVRKTFIEK